MLKKGDFLENGVALFISISTSPCFLKGINFPRLRKVTMITINLVLVTADTNKVVHTNVYRNRSSAVRVFYACVFIYVDYYIAC